MGINFETNSLCFKVVVRYEKIAGGNQENLTTLDKASSSKDQEMDAKRQRLKNNKEETSTISMDTTENNLENNRAAPIRADVDLAEDKPTTTAQTMACNQGLLDSSKEFTRPPHPILKAQTEPEFEGELLL